MISQIIALILLVIGLSSYGLARFISTTDINSCFSAYECCRYEQSSYSFKKCSNDHGCVPQCGNVWTEGCYHNNEKYSLGSVVEYRPTFCVKMMCVAQVSTTAPYVNAVIAPVSYNPSPYYSQCQGVTVNHCIDKSGMFRADGEVWFTSFTCEECRCNLGEVSCRHVKRPCPQPPHPSCIEIASGCCPIWDCSNKQIDGCPDPNSFGRVCVHYFDQCRTDEDCNEGSFCCLVAGCGKECMRLCRDSTGKVYKLGDTWYDLNLPYQKFICLQDGIKLVLGDETDLNPYNKPPLPVDPYPPIEPYQPVYPPRVDPYQQVGTSSPVDHYAPLDSYSPGSHFEVSKMFQNETVSHYDCIIKSGLNLTVFAESIETITKITESVPFQSSDFFVRGFKSITTNETSNQTFSDNDILEISSRAQKFNWSEVLPLLNENITEQQQLALSTGNLELQTTNVIARVIGEEIKPLEEDSPSIKHQVAFRRTDPIATEMAQLGLIAESATRQFTRSLNVAPSASGALTLLGEAFDCSRRFSTLLRPTLAPPCDPQSPFRTLDGTCNNLLNDLWGAAFTKFRRILPQEYGDGISSLRRDANNNPLPSARLVSSSINKRPNIESPMMNLLHVTFGQFVDHDLTATPIAKGYLGSAIKCCDDLRVKFAVANLTLERIMATVKEIGDIEPSLTIQGLDGELDMTSKILENLIETGDVVFDLPINLRNKRQSTFVQNIELPRLSLPLRPQSRECAEIYIPKDDPFYKHFDQTCMEFVRSIPAPMCSLGPREQLNQNTAYLDGSAIYGIKKKDSDALRTFNDGLLTTQVTLEGQHLLLEELNLDDGCNVDDKYASGIFCFKAGDGRVNEQALLTVLQTVWAREHNRVAKILKGLNNVGWNDERLFQEARRIVVAELQHVTYKEYLPTVIGNFLTSVLKLEPLSDGMHTTDYDDDIEATLSNAFSTAAYRYGHSQVTDIINRVNKYGNTKTDLLSSLFFNPFSLYEDESLEDYTRGGTMHAAAKVDAYFSEEVAGKLFKGTNPFGLDLVALNIQRGRDHGLPGYIEWKKICGEAVAEFKDLTNVMDEDIVEDLQTVYKALSDIDLFIGGIAERPFLDGIIGPTFTCIVADQFVRLKRGDRFWYEYKDGPGAFSKGQLKQLHKVTLARILCNNLPELHKIQKEPLKSPSATNNKVGCYSKHIPEYSFNPWKIFSFSAGR